MTAKEYYSLVKTNKSTEQLMTEFARLKCFEAIRNTRYKAIDILNESPLGQLHMFSEIRQNLEKEIENIRNQEVMPKL